MRKPGAALHSNARARSLRFFMPIGDWQFWVVSVLALAALAYLLREVLPERISIFKKRARGKNVKTSLTIGGKSVDPRSK